MEPPISGMMIAVPGVFRDSRDLVVQTMVTVLPGWRLAARRDNGDHAKEATLEAKRSAMGEITTATETRTRAMYVEVGRNANRARLKHAEQMKALARPGSGSVTPRVIGPNAPGQSILSLSGVMVWTMTAMATSTKAAHATLATCTVAFAAHQGGKTSVLVRTVSKPASRASGLARIHPYGVPVREASHHAPRSVTAWTTTAMAAPMK